MQRSNNVTRKRVGNLTRFCRVLKPNTIQPPTMPPKAHQNPKELAEQEGRIKKGIFQILIKHLLFSKYLIQLSVPRPL